MPGLDVGLGEEGIAGRLQAMVNATRASPITQSTATFDPMQVSKVPPKSKEIWKPCAGLYLQLQVRAWLFEKYMAWAQVHVKSLADRKAVQTANMPAGRKDISTGSLGPSENAAVGL